MRILIVDDEPALREVYASVLTGRGHDVETAINGVEGLAKFRKTEIPFDAVLSDYQMPRMNGILMINEILKLAPGIRVVLASGDPPSSHLIPGSVRVLRKPFGNSDLLEALV